MHRLVLSGLTIKKLKSNGQFTRAGLKVGEKAANVRFFVTQGRNTSMLQ